MSLLLLVSYSASKATLKSGIDSAAHTSVYAVTPVGDACTARHARVYVDHQEFVYQQLPIQSLCAIAPICDSIRSSRLDSLWSTMASCWRNRSSIASMACKMCSAIAPDWLVSRVTPEAFPSTPCVDPSSASTPVECAAPPVCCGAGNVCRCVEGCEILALAGGGMEGLGCCAGPSVLDNKLAMLAMAAAPPPPWLFGACCCRAFIASNSALGRSESAPVSPIRASTLSISRGPPILDPPPGAAPAIPLIMLAMAAIPPAPPLTGIAPLKALKGGGTVVVVVVVVVDLVVVVASPAVSAGSGSGGKIGVGLSTASASVRMTMLPISAHAAATSDDVSCTANRRRSRRDQASMLKPM
jgi:hypothetical protein